MTDPQPAAPDRIPPLTGPAKDFSAFIELEHERRMSSDPEFDPELFREAVELVLAKLRVSGPG